MSVDVDPWYEWTLGSFALDANADPEFCGGGGPASEDGSCQQVKQNHANKASNL